MFNPLRQDMRYHNLPVNRINDSLHFSAITLNRETTGVIHTSHKVKFEVTVIFIGLIHHPFPTSTKNKPQTFPRLCCKKFTFYLHWRTSIWSSMGNYNFSKQYDWFEIQNHFLKRMTLFCWESMILLSVIFNFSSQQIADAISPKNLLQPADPRFTQLLAGHSDSSKQYNLKQFSWKWLQKCTQAPSEIENTRTISYVFLRAEARWIKIFRCSATVQKNRLPFVLKVHIISDINMTVWIGIVTLLHYPNNWTPVNVKISIEISLVRIVQN